MEFSSHKKRKTKPQSLIVDIFIWIFLIGFATIILAPLVFMFTASLMPSSDVMRLPYPWIPKTFYWQNFWQAIRGNDGSFIYIRNIMNSIIVATTVTVSTVLLAAFTGYGLAKFPFKGRKIIFLLIMTTMMIPFEAIMIPLYLIVTSFNWQDSYAGLIVPFLTNAFGVFLMRQYLITFPDEIIDAARIDGASEFSIFWRIIMPNSLPAVATLAILTFRSQWDNLLWPLLIVQSEEMKTIPLYIIKFSSEKYTNEGAMMAVAVIASLPMFIMFFTLSKHFLSGSTLFSSRKG
ncbi:carbohydrate ABC transporter permease [Kosmotoga pacifica]|uniref:ABC transporter permease n=1 Tax=Kosmotoga pacifica TaxID=1330330 RepID=A0A0G2ZBX8_9BACT|nr:carbohydrate ABC transporter permease [Kosmotoga pacifica]AKI97059.1 ABC transporter permease [Kosmotoga pacifica]